MAVDEQPTRGPTAKSEAERIIRSHTALFSPAGDIESWSKLWTDDVVAEFPFAPDSGFPPVVNGISAWREMCSGIKAHLPDYEVHDLEAHATEAPDVFFAEWRGVSRQAGYDQSYIVKIRTKEGRVALYREYFNAAALAKGGMLR